MSTLQDTDQLLVNRGGVDHRSTWADMKKDVVAASSGNPPGMVIWFAGTATPTGWLYCNGEAVSRTTYAALFAAIGTTYGEGDASTTFNLPDLRGEFVRGLDDGAQVDVGRTLGSNQTEAFKSHAHTGTASSSGSSHSHSGSSSSAGGHTHPLSDPGHTHNYKGPVVGGYQAASGAAYVNKGMENILSDPRTTGITMSSAGSHSHSLTIDSGGDHSHTVSVTATGGTETRPRNIALRALIRY